MTKEAIEQLVDELAVTALDKRAKVSASQPEAGGFDIGAIIQRLRAWFTKLSPEQRNAIIGSLVGSGATGFISLLTGGNVPLDALLGAGLGGLGGYAGTRAHQYFTQPDELTPQQQSALHRAGEGPSWLQQAARFSAPHVGAAAGGAAAGGGAMATVGGAFGRHGALSSITGHAASDRQIAALWEQVRRRPTSSGILELRDAIAEREMANAMRGSQSPGRISRWLGRMRGGQRAMAPAGMGQQIAGGPTMGLLDRMRLYIGDPSRAKKLEQMVEARTTRRMAGMATGLPRATATAANIAQGAPGAVAGHSKLGPGFKDLLRGAWKRAPGRARAWLGIPALALGGYSIYDRLANGQEQ